MSMDRSKLEEAVAYARRAMERGDLPAFSATLLYAAEAHLATLPKKRWAVSVHTGAWVHFDSFDEAMEAVRCEARSGERCVTIEFHVPHEAV